MPASRKGWAALILCIAATVMTGLAVSRHQAVFGPVAMFGLLAATLVGGVLLTLRLAVVKGRPVD